MGQQEEQKAKHQAWWDDRRTTRAQEALDVWASVSHARIRRCDPPKMDTIFERTPDFEWLNPQSGLKEISPMPGPNSTSQALSMPELVYLAVERALADAGLGITKSVLLSLYPRSGPYTADAMRAAVGRTGRMRDAALSTFDRAAIEALRGIR